MQPIPKSEALEAIRFLSGALADDFKPHGTPNAFTEAWRRYCLKHGARSMARATFRNRAERAIGIHKLRPSAAAGRKLKAPYRGEISSKKPVDVDQACELVLFWLRKRRHDREPSSKTFAKLSQRTRLPIAVVRKAIDLLRKRGVNIQKIGNTFDIPSQPQQSYTDGAAITLESRKDNTFCFAAIGDLHAASKHTRWDVRADLIKQAEAAGAQCIFDTGNWIDGESHFNRYDLEVIGLEQQCQLLARKHPKTHLPIYAVSGDDHEGWYTQREGIDVGKYNANIMRLAGHNWIDLGYMEAHVALKNANTGKKATLAVVHPGGGSAYALSYSIQKIVESYESGEKPHVALYGHYHKLWAGLIRNIWVVQTGTAQDQTPFMRKKRLEAHVGGVIVTLRQDPRTGAILDMTPEMKRYFNKGFEAGTNRWSHHGPISQPRRSTTAIRI